MPPSRRILWKQLLNKLKYFTGFYQPPRICYAIECFVVVLGYSNSAFNPILYTFLGHDFKQRLNKSLTRTRRRFSIGNKSFASGIFFPFQSRKSSQRVRYSRTFSFKFVDYDRNILINLKQKHNAVKGKDELLCWLLFEHLLSFFAEQRYLLTIEHIRTLSISISTKWRIHTFLGGTGGLMFLWIFSNSCQLLLLLAWFHQAKIEIAKRLNVTRCGSDQECQIKFVIILAVLRRSV